jgi:hypothetical protein
MISIVDAQLTLVLVECKKRVIISGNLKHSAFSVTFSHDGIFLLEIRA